MAHRHHTGGEVGVVGPGAVEGCSIARWIQVKEPDLFGIWGIGHVQHAQTGAVVRLVGDAVLDVEVVVDRRRGGRVRPGEERVVEVFHVEEVGPRVDA